MNDDERDEEEWSPNAVDAIAADLERERHFRNFLKIHDPAKRSPTMPRPIGVDVERAQLLERARAGNAAAVAELKRRYHLTLTVSPAPSTTPRRRASRRRA